MKSCGIGGVICRGDAHHDARIGIALIARILAHAVRDHATRLGGGGHHSASGAHAKTVNAAAFGFSCFSMVHQFVFRRTQQRMSGMLAPPGPVNQALRVFDAKPDRKRLGLHKHTPLVQHGESVAGAVAQCHDDVISRQIVTGAVSNIQHRESTQLAGFCATGSATVLQQHIHHALLKPNLAPQRDDLCPQVLHHFDQFEGADVRV